MPNSQKKFTILLVDDNPNNLNLLLNTLRNDSYKLLVARNGDEAIKRAKIVLPDLILLDVLMPGIDGFETCKILKSNKSTKEIPVIFMSALTETENKVKGFEVGAVDYVTKPIQYEEVVLRVQNHLLIQELKKTLQEKNAELEERNNLLNQSLEKEKELNKLKTRFIYMASHELRNPLSLILMMAKILEQDGNENNYKKDLLEKIIQATRFSSQLLDDILIATMAQEENFKFKPQFIDLVELCQNITNDYRLINPDYKIIFEVSTIDTEVYADSKLLTHIITNILSNSLKYSPKGSIINFILRREKDKIAFIFKDNGIGINAQEQELLFDEFKRGSNVGKITGTGLGLSIVKRCVDLHNGEIFIESEKGKGTTFKIILDFVPN